MADWIVQDIIRSTKIYEASGLADSRPDGRIPIPPNDEDLLNLDHLLQLAHATPGLDRQVLLQVIILRESVINSRLGPPNARPPAQALVQVRPPEDGFTPRQMEQLTELLRPLRDDNIALRRDMGEIRESINNSNALRYNATVFGHVCATLRTIKVNGSEVPPNYPPGRNAVPLTTFATLDQLQDPEVAAWLDFYEIVLALRTDRQKRKDALWAFITGQTIE